MVCLVVECVPTVLTRIASLAAVNIAPVKKDGRLVNFFLQYVLPIGVKEAVGELVRVRVVIVPYIV